MSKPRHAPGLRMPQIGGPRLTDSDDSDDAPADEQSVSDYFADGEHPPIVAGRCRCTSIEHDRAEPGCEASNVDTFG